MATPYALVVLGPTPSTMEEATARLTDRPVVVVTHEQTGGRGRSGRAWVPADRALAVSLAFRPAWPEEAWPRLSLVAGAAAADAMDQPVRLKWPNDVQLDGRKVAGILAESSGDVAVIGMGVNLWWRTPVDGAGALYDHDPGSDAVVALARRWADAFLARVERGPERWGLDDYVAVCGTIGLDLTWQPHGRGRAVGVDAAGGLVVATPTGTTVITSGEVSEVRPA